MVNRLITPKELREQNLEDQIELLNKRLHLGERNIELIQRADPKDAILDAAGLIYTSLRNQGYSKNLALSHISGSIIAPLLNICENYDEAREETQNYIWRMFRNEVSEFKEEHGVELNAPSMLRNHVYLTIEGEELTSNIIETKKTWDHRIDFSDSDLLKGTKIKPINIDQAILLGISTLGLGLQTNLSKSDYVATYTIGQKQEKQLFQNIAIPIMQEQFKVLTNGDTPNYEDRRIRISSTLIHSYFKHALKFSNTLANRKLIDFSKIPKKALDGNVKDLQKAYFVGLLAKKLRTSKQGRTNKFWQGDINLGHNRYILGQIQELSEMYGIKTTIGKSIARLKFGKEEFPRLIDDNFLAKKSFEYNHTGLIINPYQIAKIESNN